jgi:hypothetical protein
VDDRSHACPIALSVWLLDDSKVLPPTILTWRDLQILEGIAEQGKGAASSNCSSCGGFPTTRS